MSGKFIDKIACSVKGRQHTSAYVAFRSFEMKMFIRRQTVIRKIEKYKMNVICPNQILKHSLNLHTWCRIARLVKNCN